MRNTIINMFLALSILTTASLVYLPSDYFRGLFVREVTSVPVQTESTLTLKTNNPLFSDFIRIGTRAGVDLDFTRTVRTLKPFDRRLQQDSLEMELFCREPKSLDVILFGDSTLSWGVIPSAIEQITGLKVGMFALRSLYLNSRTMRLAERIQKYYLKDDGLTIFGFAIWTQLQDPEMVRRGEMKRFESLTESEFIRFAEEQHAKCQSYAPGINLTGPREEPTPRIFSKASFDQYATSLTVLKKELRVSIGGLRESFFAQQFRHWIHPAWFTGKAEEKDPADMALTKPGGADRVNDTTPVNHLGDYSETISMNRFQFIRWDNQTLTVIGPFETRSIPSTAAASDDIKITEDQKINANSLNSLPGRKAFLITFYPDNRSYVTQRSFHEKLFKDLELIDLGLLHPTDRDFPMDTEGHPANTGGLEKSIMVARWLKKNFRSDR